jgi:hypothetical protein
MKRPVFYELAEFTVRTCPKNVVHIVCSLCLCTPCALCIQTECIQGINLYCQNRKVMSR